jgi:hypothetical protein
VSGTRPPQATADVLSPEPDQSRHRQRALSVPCHPARKLTLTCPSLYSSTSLIARLNGTGRQIRRHFPLGNRAPSPQQPPADGKQPEPRSLASLSRTRPDGMEPPNAVACPRSHQLRQLLRGPRSLLRSVAPDQTASTRCPATPDHQMARRQKVAATRNPARKVSVYLACMPPPTSKRSTLHAARASPCMHATTDSQASHTHTGIRMHSRMREKIAKHPANPAALQGRSTTCCVPNGLRTPSPSTAMAPTDGSKDRKVSLLTNSSSPAARPLASASADGLRVVANDRTEHAIEDTHHDDERYPPQLPGHRARLTRHQSWVPAHGPVCLGRE